MATKLKRTPDGYMPFFLDKLDGIDYITIQLQMNIADIKFAKPIRKKGKSNTLGLDPEMGFPTENRKSRSRRNV